MHGVKPKNLILSLIEWGRGFVKRKTAKDLTVMFLESAFLKVCTFLLIIYAARTLGPKDFGIYSLITVAILFLNEFLDFGCSNTAIRYSIRFSPKRESIFGLYLFIRVLCVLVAFLCMVFLPAIAARLFNNSAILKYVFVIFVGAAIDSLVMVIATYWQSQQQFVKKALLNSAVFFIRLIAIFIALKIKVRNIQIITYIFALSGFPLLIIFSKYLLKFAKQWVLLGIPKRLLHEMAHYEKWIIIGAVPMIIMSRLDFFVVSAFLSLEDAGLYNSAVSISGIFSIILFAARNVYFPKVTKYKDRMHIEAYISNINKLVISVIGLSALIVPFSKYIILLVLGNKYVPATHILQILLLSFIFTFWNVMLSIVFYALGHTRIMSVGAYVQLAIFAVSSWVLVPQKGMAGAAWSKCISDIVYLGFVLYFLPRIIPKTARKEN